MDSKARLRILQSLLRVKLFKKRIPLFISWPITNRCNYSCLYCGRPGQAGPEISTGDALAVIEQLHRLGTQFVFLSGGEPLVRKDLPEIVNKCRQKDIFVCLTTNGSGYLRRKSEIGRVNMLKLSLDGPEHVHDAYRAKGSYSEVIAVLEDARSDRIPTVLNPVLTVKNLPFIEDIVALARRHGAIIKFQPINYLPAGDRDIRALSLSPEQHAALERDLLRLKKAHPTVIGNTGAGIRYLGSLPQGRPMKCYAGKLFAYLMPNGDLYPCNKREEMAAPESTLKTSVQDAFLRMPAVTCETCWCTSDAELNLMMKIGLRDAFDLARRVLAGGLF